LTASAGKCSDALDPGKHAVLVASRLECLLHALAHRVPFALRHAGADATIGHDLDIAIDKLHVDEHAGVFFGVPDAQL
jgi:hypothetical protein